MIPPPEFTVLQATALWKKFDAGADTSQKAMMEALIKDAIGLLSRIIETFPTYTLHNGVHQLNVIHLMEKLLGENGIKKLSTLEAAFLLLSAYYHDIGMVFTENERMKLREEESFEDFLKQNPDAALEVYGKAELPLDIAEWYCRWAHARRVHLFLSAIDQQGKLKWNTTSLRVPLGQVCESHNLDIEELKDEKRFPKKYLGDTDLRFCAILLRLADIMDFDNTRTPEAVYNYLDLKKDNTNRSRISNQEWQKHLRSEGFTFPDADSDELTFVASPDHPLIEHEIRKFVDVIEQELLKCRQMLSFCSSRWHHFVFPIRINRDNILSQNYSYGDIQFNLDKKQVLNLLMGENLYDDGLVFIRELLQNALDTSRHREFYERSKGNAEFKAKPIHFTQWNDREGYSWIRIDDYGMGMDRNKVLKYLLKVGTSFYNSSEFMLEKLGYASRQGSDFTPISRFGIGILSCFIIGDKVEINTRSVHPSGGPEEKIRLSLNGLHDYYIMQTESAHNLPNVMVNEAGVEEKYRKEAGTSVAVRINPKKEFREVDLEGYLERIVFAPSIPIIFKDKSVNEYITNLVHTPSIEPKVFSLPKQIIEQIGDFLKLKLDGEILIQIAPINLANEYDDKKIKGYIFVINLVNNLSFDLDSITASKIKRINFTINTTNKSTLLLRITKSIPPDFGRRLKTKDFVVKIPENEFIDIVKRSNYGSNLILSHNGITLPSIIESSFSGYASLKTENLFGFNLGAPDDQDYGELFDPADDIYMGHDKAGSVVTFGCIALIDGLRPNVSASRDTIKPLPWKIYSELAFAIFLGINRAKLLKIKLRSIDIIDSAVESDALILKNLLTDPLIPNQWINIKAHEIDIVKISATLQTQKEVEISGYIFKYPNHVTFTNTLIKCLLQYYYTIIIEIETEINKEEPVFKCIKSSTTNFPQGLSEFPPLTYITYQNNSILKYKQYQLNINHPFSIWFISSASRLKTLYPNLFNLIIENLLSINGTYNRYPKIDQMAHIIDVTTKINSYLEKLKALSVPDLDPPRRIFLTAIDFIV